MTFLKHWSIWVTVAGAAVVGAAIFTSDPSALSAATDAYSGTEITVYKSPTCSCCRKWVDYLGASFKVTAHDTTDMASVKTSHGVPDEMQSCHTAIVGGYVIEGHVPVADIQRLIREKPKVAGLAVPGMPMGSPGMEGSHTDKYDVIAFGGGQTEVFARH